MLTHVKECKFIFAHARKLSTTQINLYGPVPVRKIGKRSEDGKGNTVSESTEENLPEPRHSQPSDTDTVFLLPNSTVFQEPLAGTHDFPAGFCRKVTRIGRQKR